jgi:hypothetical protein
MKRVVRSNAVLVALVASAVLLAAAGVGLLATYFRLTAEETRVVQPSSPIEAIRADQVAPDLAVLPLAGELDERVISAALDAGEMETAFAGLAYAVLLPDSVRSGRWLLLANRFRISDPERARLADLAALDQVALAPYLSDVARADIALQAARNLLADDQRDMARLALQEAESIAKFSLSMIPAQRRRALTQLVDLYADFGDAQAAGALRSRLEAASSGPGIAGETLPQLLPTLRGSIVLSPEVTEAIVTRQGAAARLAAGWLSAPPSQRQALTEDLAAALIAEDHARQLLYADPDRLELADRLALWHDQITWLTVKTRVAHGDYGLSLVAAWEEEAEAIRAALIDAYYALVNGYGQQLDVLSPAESIPARVELRRQAVQWTRLGLFPDPDGETETALREQLLEASSQLWTRQGNAGLAIVVQEVGGRRFYLLSGASGS